MAKKHTPGPWTCGTSGEGRECVWLDPNGEPEEGMGEAGTWIDCNTEGNARLIAAAPELLEALRAVLDSGSAIHAPAYMAARAVIAKATGEVA